MSETTPILNVENLRTTFETPEGSVRAVRGVSFALQKGEILGIVGESGSGKSVTCLSLMGLIKPPGIVEADGIRFDGSDLATLPARKMRTIRGKRIAMIFQDPMTSLNPFLTIGDQIGESLRLHLDMNAKEARARSIELLDDVGIPNAKDRIDAYPHQFSGGMRQRVMIAMALACNPDILIADEPTTALDVTIQAQILELIKELRETHEMSVVLITHDLGVVAGTCDRVCVMYAGQIIEKNDTRTLFKNPGHPYTRALLRSIPRLDEEVHGDLYSIAGMPPDLSQSFEGCPFEPRCEFSETRCHEEVPELEPHEEGLRACYIDWWSKVKAEGASDG